MHVHIMHRTNKMLIFFFSFALLANFISLVQPQLLYNECVSKNGIYTTSSTYHENLKNLLTSISKDNTISYGFYNSSLGEDPDKVFAIALCRPDMAPDACLDCIKTASQNLTAICPNAKEAIGGFDDKGYNYCMLQYAARSILGIMEDGPYFFVFSVENNITENVDGFNQTRNRLLDKLRVRAAAGNSTYKYAYGHETTGSDTAVYALVQCRPDISEAECNHCLENATARLPQCCTASDGGRDVGTTHGGRVIYPGCNFRYETERFYRSDLLEISPTSPTEPVVPPPPPPGITFIGKIIIIVVSVVVSMVIAIICAYIFYRARKAAGKMDEIKDLESMHFEIGTIRAATDNFSDANKLGQGGFGAVFKGILPDGQEIAVKRLSKDSKQGEEEFKNEVRILAKLQHRNLVRLHGFCLQRNERLLIYEFVPKSSLDHFLFDPTERKKLDWDCRYKIIEGIARGLLYLHQDSRLRIIHRDLKASNILLDANMNPKIADFGMARLFAFDQTQDDTRNIAGTFGYMAPEYVRQGHCSVKSDVFSFGVIVLEILMGKRRTNYVGETEDFLTYAWKNWNDGSSLNIIDPTFEEGSRDQMMRCIHIGLLCVQESPAVRPTMAKVILMLSGDFVNLPPPLRPAFYMDSITILNQSRSASVQLSRNEASITELRPR